MARNENVPLPAGVWTQLTNANASALRVQNRSASSILLKATVGEGAPTNDQGAIELMPGEILAADMTLAQLWPEPAGVNRVYAMSFVGGTASVSHANA